MTQPQQHQVAGDVGMVSHGTVTINGGLNVGGNAAADEDREILDVQRRDLHRLINDILETRGNWTEEDRVKLWWEVHKATGKPRLQEMTVDDYQPAVTRLCQLLQEAQDERKRADLMDEILGRTELDGVRERAELFCLTEFGERLFRNLRVDQLQVLLRHLMATPAPTCTHDCASCRAETAAQHVTELNRVRIAAMALADNLTDASIPGSDSVELNDPIGTMRRELVDAESAAADRLYRLRQWWLTACVVLTTVAFFLGREIG
ncbi:hypothetical protein [Chitiniphilus shinanonensis]|uniref:hypothetical protein n=1 Tax=Chitiniphilus shinanonensis TaxID=553088 RepID=UPI003039D57F